MTTDEFTVDGNETADATIVAEHTTGDDDLELHDPAEALADIGSGKLSKFPVPDAPGGGGDAPAGAGSERTNVPAIQKRPPKQPVEVIPPEGFDYSPLSVEKRKVLQEVSDSVYRRMNSIRDELLGIAGDLWQAKEACEHGEWVHWYRFEIQPICNVDLRTAQMWMKAYKAFGDKSPFGDAVPMTGLVELAGAPQEVLDKVTQMAKTKGKVTVAQIRDLKASHETKQTRPASAALAEFASDDSVNGTTDAITTKHKGDGLRRELEQGVRRRAAEAVEEIMRGYAAFYQFAHAKLSEAAEREAKGHANPLAKKTAADFGSGAAQLRQQISTYATFATDTEGGGMWSAIGDALYALETFRYATQSAGTPDIQKIAKAVRQLPEPAKSWMPEGVA